MLESVFSIVIASVCEGACGSLLLVILVIVIVFYIAQVTVLFVVLNVLNSSVVYILCYCFDSTRLGRFT